MSRVPTLMMSLVLAATACSEGVGPTTPFAEKQVAATEPVADGDVHIMKQGEAAPPLETVELSAWVVRGRRKTIRVRYDDVLLADSLRGFLKLDFHEESLAAFPDGASIAEGDSVLITVRIELGRFEWELLPHGLAFDRPVALSVRYHLGDDDLNEDGTVDAADETIRTEQLAIRVLDGDVWTVVPSKHGLLSRKFDAALGHFSNYAIAW